MSLITTIARLFTGKPAAPKLAVLLDAVSAGAADAGLPEWNIKNARHFFEYAECRIGVEIIATQLYEFKIEVTGDYFELFEQVAKRLQIPLAEYVFVKELIRSSNHVPKPVREELGLMLRMLLDQQR